MYKFKNTLTEEIVVISANTLTEAWKELNKQGYDVLYYTIY